jgi:hypothetical protein
MRIAALDALGNPSGTYNFKRAMHSKSYEMFNMPVGSLEEAALVEIVTLLVSLLGVVVVIGCTLMSANGKLKKD